MAKQYYETELKEKILRMHMSEGRTIRSLTNEYNLGEGTIKYWLKQHRKECLTNLTLQEETKAMEENLRLRKEMSELRKENEFLKKAAAFFAKEIQ